MHTQSVYKPLCGLLAIVIFATACNGQVQTASDKDQKNTPETVVRGQPKMIRTQGLAFGNVGCQLQDKAGNLWFSTGGEGVYRYDGKSFTNFTTNDGLSSNEVNVIIEDKAGAILFGTRNGLCKYDGKSFTEFTANADLNNLFITSLFEDRAGNLWFGTMTNGVYRYDGKSFTNFLNANNQLFNLGNRTQLIQDILQDKKGDLWFSSWNGGGVWRYDGKSFKNYLPSADYYERNEDERSGYGKPNTTFLPKPANSQPGASLTDDMIFSLTEDRAGNLWFATRRHGACRYDGTSFTSFREKEGFVSYGIYSILEDKKGNIWLTTERNGVWCYDGKTFKNFTTKDGLVNNSVFSVLEDKNGNLWFGTRQFGLSRYDGKTFTTFSE